MIEFFRAVVAFIVVLGVLVTVHELGHYLVARWRGVAIETFSVGFGPALLSRTDRHGTVWKLSAIPLGGYVRMKGWAELGGETKGEVAPDSFRTKSLGSRAAIVAAGPAANMVLAFVLFSAIFATSGAPPFLPVVSRGDRRTRRRRRSASSRATGSPASMGRRFRVSSRSSA
jgi:site-2 protease. Metallo peptidase. MEROPS family M50B